MTKRMTLLESNAKQACLRMTLIVLSYRPTEWSGDI